MSHGNKKAGNANRNLKNLSISAGLVNRLKINGLHYIIQTEKIQTATDKAIVSQVFLDGRVILSLKKKLSQISDLEEERKAIISCHKRTYQELRKKIVSAPSPEFPEHSMGGTTFLFDRELHKYLEPLSSIKGILETAIVKPDGSFLVHGLTREGVYQNTISLSMEAFDRALKIINTMSFGSLRHLLIEGSAGKLFLTLLPEKYVLVVIGEKGMNLGFTKLLIRNTDWQPVFRQR